MGNLIDNPQWDDVRELATTDPALGGPGGTLNVPSQNHANRARWLKDELANHRGGAAGYADDHDGRYVRNVASVSGQTLATGQTKTLYTGPDQWPPAYAIFYLDTGVWYALGTGPRATDLEVRWDPAAFTLDLKNTSGTDIDAHYAVYVADPA